MSRNDFRPGKGRQAEEAILQRNLTRRYAPCPECGKPTDVYPLRSFRGACTGRACTARQACGWEGDPIATLNAEGQVVRCDALGLPTNEPLIPIGEAL